MKKNLTEIVFILARSGSMVGLEDGGFNAMIEKQKREPGDLLHLHMLMRIIVPPIRIRVLWITLSELIRQQKKKTRF